jgi:hypothetical protein
MDPGHKIQRRVGTGAGGSTGEIGMTAGFFQVAGAT